MIHYLKEISISEAVIKDFTYFQLFWHCKRDFLNSVNVSLVIIGIHFGDYFGFQNNNWKKAGIFEYFRIRLGVIIRGGGGRGRRCPSGVGPRNHAETYDLIIRQK